MISKLQFNSYKLCKNYQLPNILYLEICKLNEHSDKGYIIKLKDLSSRYLRVYGFYKMYPNEAKLIEDAIKLELNLD